MVLKIKIVFGFAFLFFINKAIFASQILDYETEYFIKTLINDVRNVNNIDKNINFKIISDKNINAFVDENNIIYITSGLIENSPDYVALLSVIAHEIGHIDKNHIIIRKSSLKNLSNFRKITNMSVIAGSLISNNPEALQGIALGDAGLSNLYINFSKDQEREADLYSINTLKNLKTNSDSIIQLLDIIQEKASEKGFNKEKQKISTHPYFEERKDIIQYLNINEKTNLDQKLNYKFKFIKAKFLGYNKNETLISKMNNPYRMYAESIVDAQNGNLIRSMKKLNRLIKNQENNIFLIETKADILFSYGYTNESIKFYSKVLNKIPSNSYSQIRIFENTEFEKLSIKELNKIFLDNLNLLKNFYLNRNILNTYLKLSKKINKKEWESFISFWLNNDIIDKKSLSNELNKYKNTNDENLLELINLIKSK